MSGDETNINELYQEIIVDHSKHPRNCGPDASATHHQEGYNPLCGDNVTLHIHVANGRIGKVSFEGQGCAISRASASLLTQTLQGKTVDEAKALIQSFRRLLLDKDAPIDPALGDAVLLQSVKRFPVRIKCALLAWNTLSEIL